MYDKGREQKMMEKNIKYTQWSVEHDLNNEKDKMAQVVKTAATKK